MSLTYQQSEDEIFGIANVAWLAATAGMTPLPQLNFPGPIVDPPNVELIYGVTSFVVVTANQKTLSRYQGVSVYEHIGLLVIQVYSPKKKAAYFRVAKAIADAINTAFCKPSTSGEVWFRAQKTTPATGNATCNQVNVSVVCTFKTVK